MKDRYDLKATKYICQRCSVPFQVFSESFYEFGSVDYDSNFWCDVCQDLPRASLLGESAEKQISELHLLKGFVCRRVPLWTRGDVEKLNLLYRPYSKRSFLRQYIDWLELNDVNNICKLSSDVKLGVKFDISSQKYTNEVDYKISDLCSVSACEFLQKTTLKPEKPECKIIQLMCDIKGKYGLCQTGDEAWILKRYLLLTGESHYPMLIPQASILKGKRRPDFLCFVPLSKFQYQKVAILIDRPGKDPAKIQDEKRDYEEEGFKVKRILIDLKRDEESYFKIARDLVLWIGKL